MLSSVSSFKALTYFKLKAFSLFLTALFLGSFLIGCGGGSSSNNGVKTTPPPAAITDAATPIIADQPSNASYAEGDAASNLSVTASVSDEGVLSYQWYKTANPAENGSLIPDATNQTYEPSTLKVGTTYYYVVVANTNDNVDGKKTASATSSAAKIEVINKIKYTVNFYDTNLDLNYTTSIKEQEAIDLQQLTADHTVPTHLYLANNSTDISFDTSYIITVDTNFYALPNVQEIINQAQLDDIRDNLSGNYILLNDIELNSTEDGFDTKGWMPIGAFSPSAPFTGIFNGNFNKITNIWVNRFPSYSFVGLFGVIKNAQIRNLGLEIAEGKKIEGYEYVGIIAGNATSSNMTNVYSKGDVGGYRYIGGIAGSIGASSFVANSYSSGNVNGNYSYVGGITGLLDGGFITNSYSSANVNGSDSNIGGIAGGVNAGSSVTNTYSAGNIFGKGYVGGITGRVRSGGMVKYNAAINPSVNATMTDYYVNRIAGNIAIASINNGDVSNNFALDDMSVGITTAGGDGPAYHGIDKTADLLKQEAVYSDAVIDGGLGWKFGNNIDNPWKIDENNSYPYLYWQER
ncbi:MAG: hypothetical protein LBT96_01525 [Campylobacteraceae bacterium]|nr:hypothetical protein [Campylobacteraceae bacterium]